MNKAFGIIYDANRKMFLRVDLEFNLETNEANIVSQIDIGDSRARALYDARKTSVLYVKDIDMIKPQGEETNE